MLRSNNKAYVCWRCLRSSSSSQPGLSRVADPRPRLPLSSPPTALSRLSSSQRRGLASHFENTFRIPSRNDESNIRRQLREWEAENPPTVFSIQPYTSDPDGPVNSLTATQNSHIYQHGIGSFEDDVVPRLEGGELIDLGDAVSGLLPGDMIEVASDSWRIPLLAICLGNFNGYDHFYTDTGKWFAERDIRTRFVVKKFILDPGELQPIIDAIPATVGEDKILGELAELNVGPTREIGQVLRSRMLEFQESARDHNHRYSDSLNRANSLVGPEEKLMSLEEIASALLPTTAASRGDEHAFPVSLLYAVHCSISLYHELIFRPLQQNNRRYGTYLFAVASEEDAANLFQVEDILRRISEEPKGKAKGSSDSSNVTAHFQLFLQRVGQAIDRSRRSRQWSPGGLLGPERKEISKSQIRWSAYDMAFIKFMQQWAASGRIPRSSRLHWVGATILRATGRYADAEFLDGSVGWTFLQEIGWTAPWDIPDRHSLRLPGVPTHGSNPLPAPSQEQELGPDLMASLRKDFTSATVYCIDAEQAEDIDDGFSIEPTEKEGEYWVNVHIADPASRIAPNSPLAKLAAAKAQTTYLTGYVDPMFTTEAVRENLSLGPDRPSLTFSALVNEAGDILDYEISPHVIKDVVYMTTNDAAVVCGDDSGPGSQSPFEIPTDYFEVGTPPNPSSPTRKMTKPEELSEKQMSDIKMLDKLAKALHEVRLRNGSVPVYLPEPKAEVSFEHASAETLANGFVHCSGDPYIRVEYQHNTGSLLVSSIMLLAGSVAARWCHERRIPIPYRTQLLAEQNAEAIKKFTQGYLYPKLRAGQRPSGDDLRIFRNLSGGFGMATRPTPNMSMGLDMYVKATSPLRRYSDLLAHWQIEAALLEESVRGGPPSSSGTNGRAPVYSNLPFSREVLDEKILPQLLIRERYSKRLANVEGNHHWMLQALARAWRFGEGKEKLPETFRFKVDRVMSDKLRGSINWFNLRRCIIPIQGLGGKVTLADVKQGDEFVVKVTDVDVYNQGVTCKILEKVEKVGKA